MSFSLLLCFLSSLLSKSHWTEAIWVAERCDPSGLVLSDWAAIKPQTVCLLRLTEISTSSSFIFIHLFCLFSFPMVSLYCLCLHFGLWFFFCCCCFVLLGVTCSKGEDGREYEKKGRMTGIIFVFLYKNITRQKTLHKGNKEGDASRL